MNMTIEPFSLSHVKAVSEIFTVELSKGFLSQLGKKFLENIYFAYIIRSSDAWGYIAKDEKGSVIGFVFGSKYGGFYSKMLKQNAFLFLYLCLKTIIIKPKFFFYIISMFFIFNEQNENPENSAELLYMAVSKEYQRSGIGQRLLYQLQKSSFDKGMGYLLLQTLVATPQAGNFYLKNGFDKIKTKFGRIWFAKNLAFSLDS